MGTLGLVLEMLMKEDGRVATLLEGIALLFLNHSHLLRNPPRLYLLPAVISTVFEHSLHEPLMLLVLLGRQFQAPQDDMHFSPLNYLLFSKAFLSF